MGFRSPSFNQFLVSKCAWDEQVEREVFAGKRPIADLTQLLKCRDRATQDAAHQVLTAARQKRSPGTPGPKAPAQPGKKPPK
jgi:hypothetical protein